MKTDDRPAPRATAAPTVSRLIYVPMLGLGFLGSCFALIIYSYAFGQDLMVFHTAGRLAEVGDYSTLIDGGRFTDLLVRTHKAWLPRPLILHPWVYPPSMLPVAMAIGALPFSLAYPGMMAVSLLMLLLCIWRCWPARPGRDLAILLLLLSPGTGCCIGAGQVSFLVAGIVLTGLAILPRGGFAAGLLLSLLTLKPQFAILVPLALVCGGHRNAFIGFTLGAATLVAFSLAMVGPAPWLSWIRFIAGGDTHFAEWARIGRSFGQSVDAYLLVLGLASRLAEFGQVVASLLAACIVGWTFATTGDTRRRMIVFLAMATLGAPHISNYDSILSGLAAALVLTAPGGSANRMQTVVAALVWLSALVNPPIIMKLLGIPALVALSAATPPLLLLLAGATIATRRSGAAAVRQDRNAPLHSLA